MIHRNEDVFRFIVIFQIYGTPENIVEITNQRRDDATFRSVIQRRIIVQKIFKYISMPKCATPNVIHTVFVKLVMLVFFLINFVPRILFRLFKMSYQQTRTSIQKKIFNIVETSRPTSLFLPMLINDKSGKHHWKAPISVRVNQVIV